MVNNKRSSLDATFAALADPTRRAILERLARGRYTVSELAQPFAVSLPAVSKHLRVLERAGLLHRERDGRIRRCAAVPEPLEDAAAWIESYRRFWQAQFDALAHYLEASAPGEEATWRTVTQTPPRPSGSREPSPRRATRSSGPGQTRRR